MFITVAYKYLQNSGYVALFCFIYKGIIYFASQQNIHK